MGSHIISGLFLAFGIAAASGLKPGARTVKIGPQTEVDNEVYLYKSVYHSYQQYLAAKKAAELGLTRAADDYICYEGYGCYFKNGTYSNFYALPSAPTVVNTKFYLYTSAAQKDPEWLDYKSVGSIHASEFDETKPTVVVLHGFASNVRTAWAEPLREAMFRGSPNGLNYIFADWGAGAKAPNYWGAAANTQIAGAQLARLIALLNTVKKTKSSQYHIIGHSLGAHAAGFTAQHLRQLGHERVGKITGLDPAGPIFGESHNDAKLSIGDADFVTGIHGNAAPLKSGGLGLYDRVGDIDFYPNGGQFQPGCPFLVSGVLWSIITFDWDNVPESAKCNHNRAIDYAIESVDQSCSHVSYGCDSYLNFREGRCFAGEKGVLGIFVQNQPAKEEHFLVTKESAQIGFCAHPMKIMLRLSAVSPSSSGSLFVTLVSKNGVEETVEQMADKEQLPPSKAIVEIVASKAKISDLAAIKIRYEPECGWITCSSDRITTDGIEVDSLEANGGRVCAGFEILYKGDTVTFRLGACRP